MYFVKTPLIIKRIFPQYIWNFSRSEPFVYLTFDDGPHPEITTEVLQLLRKYNAKATFFCVGKNVVKFPEVYNKIISDGHLTGNHTFSHKNAWKCPAKEYLQNIEQCDDVFWSPFFRPPYGKITKKIKISIDKKIIMWDILSGDFDRNISPDNCLKNVLKNIRPGSIIVFHDSEKAYKNLTFALPKVLEYIASKGWQCETIKKGLH